MNVDLERVRELVAMVRESRIYELTISDGDSRVTIKRHANSVPVSASEPEVEYVESPAAPAGAAPAETPAPEPQAENNYIPVTAEWVGTVHLGDGPDSAPLVAVGQRVASGQKICVIESMRLMHDVNTPVSGTVVQILAEDNQPVEYGETLVLLQSDEGE